MDEHAEVLVDLADEVAQDLHLAGAVLRDLGRARLEHLFDPGMDLGRVTHLAQAEAVRGDRGLLAARPDRGEDLLRRAARELAALDHLDQRRQAFDGQRLGDLRPPFLELAPQLVRHPVRHRLGRLAVGRLERHAAFEIVGELAYAGELARVGR